VNAVLRIAAWILAIALVTMPIVAVLNGWVGGSRWPMRHLAVTGEFQQVRETQVREAVLPYVGKGFFAVDLNRLRADLAGLPWVKHVEVRKRWPDRLEVSLSEYRPLAHWGEQRMLSEHGELFPAPAGVAAKLPRFVAPDARASEMMAFYSQAKPLFLGTGLSVVTVVLSARGSWNLVLSDGTRIEVGRGDPQSRLQRFARMLPRIRSSDGRVIDRADLRYTNGFALSWRASPAGQGGTDTQVRAGI
jgi:cell division protein FtsQ